MPSLKNICHYWSSMIVVAVIIYVTWIPRPIESEYLLQIPYVDKLIHAIMMGGLLGALLFDYQRQNKTRALTAKRVLEFAICVAAFGVFNEIIQGTLPIERSFDLSDILANWLGTLVAYFIAPPAIKFVLHIK